jgi:hypothetical protein
MSEQGRIECLEHFRDNLAHGTSEDEEIANHQLRARGLDPDDVGEAMITEKRRILGRAKAEEERHLRKGIKPKVEARVQELIEKFDTAIEALKRGLEEEELSVQYRNLESEPTEEEAKQMLREEIELKLSEEE